MNTLTMMEVLQIILQMQSNLLYPQLELQGV